MMFVYVVFFILMMMAVGCQKDSARDSCNGAVPAKAEFFVRENLSDTAFIADTVFRDNYVTFEAIGSYYSTVWSIGSDEGIYCTIIYFELC